MKTAVFVDKKTKKKIKTKIPCLENLVFTIRSFLLLTKRLQNIGFTELDQRKVNQDPLENLFGESRKLGQTVRDPTSVQFSSHFLILMMRQMTQSFNVYKPNCEKDSTRILFQWHQSFNVLPEYSYSPVIVKPSLTEVDLVLSPRLFYDILQILANSSICETCTKSLTNRLDTLFSEVISRKTGDIIALLFEQVQLKNRACHQLSLEVTLKSILCDRDCELVNKLVIPVMAAYYINYATDYLNKVLSGSVTPTVCANPLVVQCFEK